MLYDTVIHPPTPIETLKPDLFVLQCCKQHFSSQAPQSYNVLCLQYRLEQERQSAGAQSRPQAEIM